MFCNYRVVDSFWVVDLFFNCHKPFIHKNRKEIFEKKDIRSIDYLCSPQIEKQKNYMKMMSLLAKVKRISV